MEQKRETATEVRLFIIMCNEFFLKKRTTKSAAANYTRAKPFPEAFSILKPCRKLFWLTMQPRPC